MSLRRHVAQFLFWVCSFLLLGWLLVSLTGCGWGRDTHQQVAERETTTTERPAFAPDGTGFVEVTKTVRVRDQVTEEHSDTALHAPEVGAVVSAVANGATGGGVGSLVAIGTGLLTTGGALVAAWLKNGEAKRHRADADEGWAKATEKGEA